MKNQTDIARKKIASIMPLEFEEYITNKLAGDFAYKLVQVLEKNDIYGVKRQRNMEIDEIEYKIACGEMTAAQVFTQMRQYIDVAEQLSRIYFLIASSRIGCDQVRAECDRYISDKGNNPLMLLCGGRNEKN